MAGEIRAFALVLLAAGTLGCASTRATIAERLFASDEQTIAWEAKSATVTGL